MVRLDTGSDSIARPITEADFVEVMFARTSDEASHFRSFLSQKAIPALVERNPELPDQCGVAVLVPSEKLVEASQQITWLMAHDDDDDEDVEFDDDDDDHDDDLDDFDDDDDDSDFDDDDDDDSDDDDDIPDDDDD